MNTLKKNKINENKYLTLVSNNESREKIKKIWRTVEQVQRFNEVNNLKLRQL